MKEKHGSKQRDEMLTCNMHVVKSLTEEKKEDITAKGISVESSWVLS